MEGKWITKEEVAEELAVSAKTVQRWIAQGKLEAFRQGRVLRISRSSLDELVNAAVTGVAASSSLPNMERRTSVALDVREAESPESDRHEFANRSGGILDTLWARLLERVGRRLPPAIVDSRVKSCTLSKIDGDHLIIAAPNPLSRNWVAQQVLGALEEAAAECLGGRPRISLVVDDSASATDSSLVGASPGVRAGPCIVEGLNPRYNFERFIVGPSNRMAAAACEAVADLPSRAYNPLFVYGGVGLGKTHLLHAVGHRTSASFPGTTGAYLSSERFTSELMYAIRYDRMAEFRGRYRAIDLLLLDDIQFISGKERTQEELLHTFDNLYESHKQIIITSDCQPKDIPEIEERLRSRLECGLITDVQPPEFETRAAILKKKAALERVLLPDDVVFLIASRVKSNIRELEGSLTRMIAFCELTGREMNIDLAHEVLTDLWGDEEKIITIELVQHKVCDLFGVKVADLKTRNRTKTVTFPRQVAMYLARKLTHASLAEVGRAFGGKDHTSVLHAVAKIEMLLAEDTKLRKMVDGLTQTIQLPS